MDKSKAINTNIDYYYHECFGNKWTFQMKPAKNFVERYATGLTLNLFAGKTRLEIDEIRVDISDEFKPDFRMDAFDFIEYWLCNENKKFQTIIFDPPFSFRKSKEKYDGKFQSKHKQIKLQMLKLLEPKGRIISFGYATTGIGKKYGFEKIAILNLCHWGDLDNTLAVVEERQEDNPFIIHSGVTKDIFGVVEQNTGLNKWLV